jgi:hypothetical protein
LVGALVAASGCAHAVPPSPFESHEVASNSGYSDLVFAKDRTLWAVTDNSRQLVHLSTRGEVLATTPIGGEIGALDTEAIALRPDGIFLVGTEASELERPEDFVFEVTGATARRMKDPINYARLWQAATARKNKGIEGICFDGKRAFVAVEDLDSPRAARMARSTETGGWQPFRVAVPDRGDRVTALACRALDGGRTEIFFLLCQRKPAAHLLVRAVIPSELAGLVPMELVADLDAIGANPDGSNLEGLALDEEGKSFWIINDNAAGAIPTEKTYLRRLPFAALPARPAP